jgi:3-deoxy-D-manno-octulosonic-acid transferase
MYLLYTVLYALVLVITLPYWLIAMLRSGKYRAGLSERLGRVPARLKLPRQEERTIWFHAVSVGEVLAVTDLISALKILRPETRVFISTTTLTGQTLAQQRFGEANVFYMPLDLPFAVNAVLRALHPTMLVLAETEFWPNVLRLSKTSGASIAVVNARISDRSLPGYRRFRRWLSPVLKSVDVFLAQANIDAERLVEIGAPPERVQVGGNLKFDAKIPADSALSQLLRQVLASDQHVLVFGSTVDDEEALLVPGFKAVLSEFPKAVIILAPRHPERFDTVVELLHSSGFSFWRRSAWNGKPISGGVLLLDTIGELASVYSLAQITFVGGSLVPRGGHNILEPAQFAKPILIGPHYENFRAIVDEFVAHDAVRIVQSEHLPAIVLRLLQSPEEAADLGRRAALVVSKGQGSVQRTLEALLALLDRDPIHRPQLSVPRA